MSGIRIVVVGSLLTLAAAVASRFFSVEEYLGSGRISQAASHNPNGHAPIKQSQQLGSASSRSNPIASATDSRPFLEIRAELEQRASNGDSAAARRLGMTFAYCNHYQPISSKHLEDGVVEMTASGMTIIDQGNKITPYTLLQRLKVSRAQADRMCKNAAGLHESYADASKLAYTWIEKGASLGDADSQAMYASVAFASYDARTALANAEEVRDRKQRAIDYLQQSLETGDALALLELSKSYASGMLFPKSDITSYAYLYAYSLTSRASESDPDFLGYLLAQAAKPLDDTALQQAREEGRRLAGCCAVSPESL